MFFVIFTVSFLAVFLGSVSGGSASIISVPCWLSLGFALPTAIACDKISATLWCGLAAKNYLKGRQLDWGLLAGLIGFGIIGAIAGSRTTATLDPKVIKPLVGGLIILLVCLSWYRKDFGLNETKPTIGTKAASLLGLPLGFYEGFFGSGNSILSSFIFCKSRGFDIVGALGHYYILANVWCATAAISYFLQGFFSLELTLPAVLGAICGAQTGSLLARRIGALPVKILMSIAGIVFGGKLLFF